MENELRVTLIQTSLYWERREANLAMFDEKLYDIPTNSTDIVVLPEMFSTSFTMNAELLAEPMNFHTHKFLTRNAARLNAVITGSIIIKENNNYYNRLFWVEPNGSFTTYDKNHLFRMAGEDNHFSKGTDRIIVEWKGWKIMPQICYDLRFPVWNRRSPELDFDILMFVANWPRKRVNAWTTLLKARAIENLSYTIGVNRIGEDGNGIAYNGQSIIVDPKGQTILSLGNEERTATFVIKSAPLIKIREKFPAHLDANEFIVRE